jgi:glycosyltransferase involved in cell wall biosynthesis
VADLDVAIVLGTYNRLGLLQAAVSSIRRSVGVLSYTIIVVDGGSTDGSVEWLADQDDVTLIAGDLSGAVRNFNLGFARAVDYDAAFIGILNDDDELIGPEPEIQRCVEWMRTDGSIGGITFESDLRGKWACEKWRDKSYCNKGLVRREALMAAARAQGDETGRKFWSEEWRTYAADTQAGLLIWKLGWRIIDGVGWRVRDNAKTGGDSLRKQNVNDYVKGGTARIFTERWKAANAADYDPEFAQRFGGYVH